MSEEATLEKEAAVVAPFTIEADHPRNSDLLIQAIPGRLRLRSAIMATRTVKDQRTGDERVPVDQSRGLASMPPVPGMHLRIIPQQLRVVVTDPLEDESNARLKSRLFLYLRESAGYQGKEVRGAEEQRIELDPHQMKTLIREVLGIVQNKEAKVVKGSLPAINDVDGMEGRYLLNSGQTTYHTQPRYEDEWSEWLNNLSRLA